jgi:3',5'-cyclic AMP phosphodiesterase CpdA
VIIARLRTVVCLALSFFLIGCRTNKVTTASTNEFTIIQMCDPQLGMGGYEADKKRFAQAVKQIDELHADLVVICGDLVNHAEPHSFEDFNAIRASLNIPCYCAPGNHDVGNTVTPEHLEQYRKYIGKDYYSFQHKGFLFVVANTQLWKSPLSNESEKHDEWFRHALEEGAVRHQPIIVVSHFPIFVKKPDEPDNYYNIPLGKREELLALFRRFGVVAHLAGHTHTTQIHYYDGIQMVASQNTSKNFDKQPFGFRLWHLGGERPYHHEFIPLPASFQLSTNTPAAQTGGRSK